jgi:protein-tyrosine phosphatase
MNCVCDVFCLKFFRLVVLYTILKLCFCWKIEEVADKEDTDLKQYFNECFDFIDEAKKNGGYVLVHCYAGRSRR